MTMFPGIKPLLILGQVRAVLLKSLGGEISFIQSLAPFVTCLGKELIVEGGGIESQTP